MALITLNNLSKSFHDRPVYSNATAGFAAGKITGLVGPNGSGKSLLFRMLCGFVIPDSGEISVDPKYLSPKRDFPEKFGIIIDRPGFLNHLTGLENLELLAKIRGVIGRKEIAGLMAGFGLDPELKQKVRHYSLGMRQKLALIQAFMEDPEVLILDEPFNALDADSVADVKQRIIDFNKNGGTVIFTSHNSADIDELAHEVYEVRDAALIKR
jgi:ABC-2 type transport system ATP-binding protein